MNRLVFLTMWNVQTALLSPMLGRLGSQRSKWAAQSSALDEDASNEGGGGRAETAHSSCAGVPVVLEGEQGAMGPEEVSMKTAARKLSRSGSGRGSSVSFRGHGKDLSFHFE